MVEIIGAGGQSEPEAEEGVTVLNEPKLWWYAARVTRVVDGDTLDLMVDLGFQTYQQVRVRLYGIDTPEVYGVKKGSEEYEKGKKASAFAVSWCEREDRLVWIRSHDGRALGKAEGKYGRWIVEVFPADSGRGADSLNEALVLRGLAERKDYD